MAEIALAEQWRIALRNRDVTALTRLASHPFELRDEGLNAHVKRGKAAAGPTEMPVTLRCLLGDDVLGLGARQQRSGRVALVFVAGSAPRARRAEPSQCFAQEAIEGSLSQRWLALQLLERGTGLCLAKAQVAQRGEDLGANLERLRLHAATVFSAVGMSDTQSASFASINGDLATMGSPVMP